MGISIAELDGSVRILTGSVLQIAIYTHVQRKYGKKNRTKCCNVAKIC